MGKPHFEWLELQLWGADTEQFATHYRGKKHKASIAPPFKAKRQMPMTQFFSDAAARAPPTDDDAPPLETFKVRMRLQQARGPMAALLP